MTRTLWLARDCHGSSSHEIYSGEPRWNGRSYKAPEGVRRACLLTDEDAEALFGLKLEPGERVCLEVQVVGGSVTERVEDD